jgi:cyclic pyranopterin phosphate synthase
LLQSEDQADELQASVISQLGLKALGHGLHQGDTGITPHLASVGG